MKPVELEIIMRDSTRQGMQSAVGNMSVLEKCIQSNTLMLGQLEKALKEMQTQFAGSTKTVADQTDNIAMMEALKKEIDELKVKLIDLEKVKKTPKNIPIELMPEINTPQFYQQVQSMVKQLESEIAKTQVKASITIDGAVQQNEIAKIKTLSEELEKLNGVLQKMEIQKKNTNEVPVAMPNVGKATTQFNGLGMSIQQVARELPSLTMGANMFFLAISNNLPMLADNLRIAKAEVKALNDAGKKSTPVWKQVVSSIFSWQTAMVVGITMLTLFGKEIGEWVKGLFKSKEAIDSSKIAMESFGTAQKKLNEQLQQSYASYGTQRTILENLRKEWNKLGSDLNDKKKFVADNKTAFDQLNVSVTSVHDAESLLVSNTTQFVEAMKARAMAIAAQDTVKDLYAKQLNAQKNAEDLHLGAKAIPLYKRKEAESEAALQNSTNANAFVPTASVKAVSVDGTTADHIIEKWQNEKEAEAKKQEEKAEQLGKQIDRVTGIFAKNKEKSDKILKEIGLEPAGGDGGKQEDNESFSIDNISAADLKARQKIDDMYLALMAEGAEKERAQAALDFELEKQRIKKEETERLALYESLKKAGAKVDPNQPAVIKRQAESQQVLAGVDYDNKVEGINEKETQGKRDNFEKLLKPYRDFAQQRIDIEQQYDADIEQLQKAKAGAKGNAGQEQLIDDSLIVAEEEKANALAELDRVFAEKDVYFQVLMSRLGAMSLEELQKALVNAEKALQNSELSGGKNSKETAVARAKVAALKDEIKVAKAEEETKAPDDVAKWKKTSASIKKCKDEIDNMIDSMDFLDEGTKAALQTASNVAGGAIAMIDGIKTLSVSAGESISAVEKASVILAIVGAAIQIMTAIFSMASAAEEKHQKTLKEIADAKLAMQREYNLLLLQQNLLMKEATTIFGEKEIAKAANAIAVYREAIRQYKEELQGEAPTRKLTLFGVNGSQRAYKNQMAAYEKGIGALNNVEIKTGHKKTGLFGWGKGKDIYSSVLSVYPDLIDGENKLNVERAKTILSTQTMSDENKNLLQNLIDLQEQAEEAQEALRDYLQDTFGGLGDGIMESITDAIQAGNDAWESFGNKGAEVLEDLGKQIAYSLFFADKFKKLQKDLEAIYGTGKSEEDIAKDAMNLLGDFYSNIGKDMDLAQDFMEKWKEEAAKKGFDLWKPEETEQSGKAGALTTITQDQGMKLEGLFTSVQGHVRDIDDAVKDVVMVMYEAFDVLLRIEANTAYCKHLEQMATDIAELKRDGFKLR